MAEARAVMAREVASPEEARLSDLLWLGLALALFIGTGLGVRAPWPADEPRFALVAREMVHTGDWLFPRIGGDLYPDKPPVYFWLLSIFYWLTGSLRASFLIPAFIASCTVVGLIYDLGRRIAGRAAGLAAGLTLACSIQFVMTMRGAQIDPVLCAFTTLSLYALLRHLLFGPAWGWYFFGGVVAGLGVVTKGVGFLPLLTLLAYAILRARGFRAPVTAVPEFSRWRWALVVPGFLLGVSVWLVPMLVAVATSNDPALIAYRDEILFQQTVHRYASAWHHVKPWYFFIAEVIPGLWLPLSLLLFWLVPRWAGAWRERDLRVWLPLAWALLTLLFFSLSAGKRGIYIFPALPAVALAAAPYLPSLFERRGVRRASVVLGGLLLLGGVALLIAEAAGHEKLHAKIAEQGVDSMMPFMIFVGVGAVLWTLAAVKKPILAWPMMLAAVAAVWSYGITPGIDGERSARDFMKKTLELVPRDTELGLLAYKEQFLLYLDRPIVNFGHARWREGAQEAYDASAWLNAGPGRVLLVPESVLAPCFVSTSRQLVGRSSSDRWVLVKGQAETVCAEKGDGSRAIRYRPPVFAGR
jgi:4-amino-4-deoxy-L-arabinose transferase-like glycosyltransferase